MNNVLLVTPEFVKKHSQIDRNVDDDFIIKSIIKAQSINLHDNIGTKLYDKLMIDCPNFNGIYLELVNKYVQPMLVEWVVYYIYYMINFQITNKAVVKKTSEVSQTSDLEEIKFLMALQRNHAEFLTNRLISFLKKNMNNIPEYCNNDCYDVKPNRNGYYSGIFINKKSFN